MEDGPAKPDPFPVTRAAELLGVDPKDTALVSVSAAAVFNEDVTLFLSLRSYGEAVSGVVRFC